MNEIEVEERLFTAVLENSLALEHIREHMKQMKPDNELYDSLWIAAGTLAYEAKKSWNYYCGRWA